jgi:hypothetical protein
MRSADNGTSRSVENKRAIICAKPTSRSVRNDWRDPQHGTPRRATSGISNAVSPIPNGPVRQLGAGSAKMVIAVTPFAVDALTRLAMEAVTQRNNGRR